MLNTPVLFLVFNRPDTTIQVFDRIRQAAPRQLFIAADGPRPDKPEDIEKCRQVWEIVNNIDWDCEVRTLFRKSNLGCGRAVNEAITWFFDIVDLGIILEDDCLPSISFFKFCQEMLTFHRASSQIMMISGTNHLMGRFDNLNGYYYSTLGNIWGWATWKRAWKRYSFTVENSQIATHRDTVNRKIVNQRIARWVHEMLASVRGQSNPHTWDIQHMYSLLAHDGVAIVPYRNLVQNIGLHGTHTGNNPTHPFFYMPIKELSIPTLVHPKKIIINNRVEAIAFSNIINYGFQETWLNKLRSRTPNILRHYYQSIKKALKK